VTKKVQFLVGLFLLCMCVLMLQIVETRILSVISFYHLAFFAISMAMFGMTAGSLIVYFNPRVFAPENEIKNRFEISELQIAEMSSSTRTAAALGGAATKAPSEEKLGRGKSRGASISRQVGGLPSIANLQNEPNLAAIAAHPKSDELRSISRRISIEKQRRRSTLPPRTDRGPQ
jgi:hypothetical protein